MAAFAHRPRFAPLVLGASLAALLVATGCGASATATTAPPRTAIPTHLSEVNYADGVRAFYRLPVDDPDREALRQQLIAVLAARTPRLAESHDYPALVEHLYELTQLYTPNELAQGPLSPELDRVAQLVIAQGSPRGDEGRVLSALLLRSTLHPDQPELAEAYTKLADWGKRAREALAGLGPLEDYEGLVEAWEEHVRLTPTPQSMDSLARLYIARRDALIALFQRAEGQLPLSQMVFQGVQRTLLDVAAVYLARGDLASAQRQVSNMSGGQGLEQRLAEAIEIAREDSVTGAGAMLDLARKYMEGGRTDVSLGMCRYGLRRMPHDPRFHQCLARTAAVMGDYSAAMAWYAEAVALAPDERPLYDEILEVLGNLIEQGLTDNDPTNNRRLGTRAIEILKQRTERWPDSPSPISPADLYLVIGVSEMNAGHAAEAEARLRESLTADDTVKTRMQLGLLLARTGRAGEAIAVYQQALQATPSDGPQRSRARAELLEQLGDAQRAAGNAAEAQQTYRQALELWNVALSGMRGNAAGQSLVRRGVLLDRVDRHDESVAAFEQAMQQAPGVREVYAAILTHLVATGRDHALANTVFRRAQVQIDLEPEWKVYFALWLRANAARQGIAGDADADMVLSNMTDGTGWSGRLARFANGTLPYAQLLEEASTVGERTEAHFYESMRLLAAGKTAEADALLREVLATQMINFYEYAMAHELIAMGVSLTAAVSAPSPVAAVQPQ